MDEKWYNQFLQAPFVDEFFWTIEYVMSTLSKGEWPYSFGEFNGEHFKFGLAKCYFQHLIITLQFKLLLRDIILVKYYTDLSLLLIVWAEILAKKEKEKERNYRAVLIILR